MVILRPPVEPLGDGAIVVRRSCERDVEALVRCGDDPDVAETVWLPIPRPCTPEAAVARLAEFERGWEQENRYGPALVVAEARTDAMIGVLFLRLREHGSVELSYGVAPAHRNRGVATAALALVTRWCLEQLAAARVRASDRRKQPRLAASPRESRLQL